MTAPQMFAYGALLLTHLIPINLQDKLKHSFNTVTIYFILTTYIVANIIVF
jgi:hypothetical protein